MAEEKKTEADIKMQDANNFYSQLLKKINSCFDKNNLVGYKHSGRNYSGKCRKEENNNDGCLSKETDEEICDGKKIKRYLDYLVPEWKDMRPSRLYKHIQKMHENAEEIRRFEIDLIWRRALYFIPLIVIFFTAFGGAFFSFQNEFGVVDNKFIYASITINQNDKIASGIIKGHISSNYGDKKIEKENEFTDELTYKNKLGHYILLAIAFINACLCFLLTKMNVESQRWQNNWECHIDYLQQILGFKLMQTCLRPRGGYFSIRKTNTFIGFIVFLVWYSIIIILVTSIAKNLILQVECDNYSLCVYNYFWIITLGIIAPFINYIYYCLTGEFIFKETKVQKHKKVRASKSNQFYIRELEIFVLKNDMLKEYNDKNKVRFHFTIFIFSIPFILSILTLLSIIYIELISSEMIFLFILIVILLFSATKALRHFIDSIEKDSKELS